VRSIPFAQLVSHEGHYPFKNIDLWTSGEKGLPGSFMPSREAQLEPEEWERFAFAPEHCEELGATLDVPLFMLRPPMSTVTEGGTGTTSRVAPEVLVQHPPATPASSHDYEELDGTEDEAEAVAELPEAPRPVDNTTSASVPTSVEEKIESSTRKYGLRHTGKVDYCPPAQLRRVPTSGSGIVAKFAELQLSPRVAPRVAHLVPPSVPTRLSNCGKGAQDQPQTL